MQDTVKGIFTAEFQVWRRTHITDPGGGQSDTYALHSTVWGMYYPGAGSNALTERPLEMSNQIFTAEDYTLHFPVRTDIEHEDRLVVEGMTLEVKTIGQTTVGLEIQMQVGANEVT
jgi:hypothetical protein